MVEVTLIFPTQGVCLEACKVMVNHGIWNLLGLEAIKYFLPNTRVWRMSEGDITIIFIIDSYIKHQAKEIKTDMQLQAHYDVEIKRDRCSLLSRKSTSIYLQNGKTEIRMRMLLLEKTQGKPQLKCLSLYGKVGGILKLAECRFL